MDVIGWVGVPDTEKARRSGSGLHAPQIEREVAEIVERARVRHVRCAFRKIAQSLEHQVVCHHAPVERAGQCITAQHPVRHDASLLRSLATPAPRGKRD
jgi:hypothetical protein